MGTDPAASLLGAGTLWGCGLWQALSAKQRGVQAEGAGQHPRRVSKSLVLGHAQVDPPCCEELGADLQGSRLFQAQGTLKRVCVVTCLPEVGTGKLTGVWV